MVGGAIASAFGWRAIFFGLTAFGIANLLCAWRLLPETGRSATQAAPDVRTLKRNYMPPDYRRDAGKYEIAGTVFVETEWDPKDPLGEVAWVKALREKENLPSVLVAQAWLDRADAESVLAAHGQTDFVRGIRHKPKAASRPDLVEKGAPGSMGDPKWRAGFAQLAPNGLSFDLQTPWWHLYEAADLAQAFPETQIILNHTGLPSDRSEEGLAGWVKAMRALAGNSNAAVKISGLGRPDHPWTPEDNRWIVNSVGRITGAHTDVSIAVLSHGHRSMPGGVTVVQTVARLTRQHLEY